MLQSERRINGLISTGTRYNSSSLANHVAKLAVAIRTHGTIENNLHCVLDVSFDEDACRIRKDHAPQNFSRLRCIALNLLGQERNSKMRLSGDK